MQEAWGCCQQSSARGVPHHEVPAEPFALFPNITFLMWNQAGCKNLIKREMWRAGCSKGNNWLLQVLGCKCETYVACRVEFYTKGKSVCRLLLFLSWAFGTMMETWGYWHWWEQQLAKDGGLWDSYIWMLWKPRSQLVRFRLFNGLGSCIPQSSDSWHSPHRQKSFRDAGKPQAGRHSAQLEVVREGKSMQRNQLLGFVKALAFLLPFG